MKKFMILLLALLMLAGNACALEVEGAQLFPLNEKTMVDLDGDGGMETVILEMEGDGDEEYLALYLFGADGSFHSYEMYVMRLLDAFAYDVDSNGYQELFVVCDYYSDDYVTFCFNYSDIGGLLPLWFTGLDRQGFTQAYVESGYGKITGVDGDILTLTGARDVLGTWMASREYIMLKGRFELIEDLYRIETQDSDWEDRALIAKAPLEATLEDGSTAVFPAGEKFLPTASDAESIVHLITRDGIKCSLEISANEEEGWGWLVGGVPEEEVFEYIPYAD